MSRRPALSCAAALAASAVVAALASPAQAAPPPDVPASDVARHATGADKAGEQRKVRKYWTKKRMRGATPRVLGVRSGGPMGRGAAETAKGKPDKPGKPGKPGDGGSGDGNPGSAWAGGGVVEATAGKVFFTAGGTNYVCSGNAVTSADESTVVTAGHCAHDGPPGGYATNWMFAPGYDDGATPYGEWVAVELLTTNQWAGSGDFDYDVAMAEVGTLGGDTLTDTVGSQGIAFNQPRSQFVHAFGYPAAKKYNGQELTYCSGTTTNDTFGGSNALRLTCTMTGGSSGGPWLADFDASTGVGTQVSLNSYGYRGDKKGMYGPYFGTVVQNLYNAAQN